MSLITRTLSSLFGMSSIYVYMYMHKCGFLFLQVADVVVHCLDHKIVKEKGLAEAFPAICK